MNQFEMKQRAYQSPLKSRALQVLLYLIDRSNKEQTSNLYFLFFPEIICEKEDEDSAAEQ